MAGLLQEKNYIPDYFPDLLPVSCQCYLENLGRFCHIKEKGAEKLAGSRFIYSLPRNRLP
jgi:hypothetical protein